MSGFIRIAGQYPGTGTNDAAAAGNIGEHLTAVLSSGSAITLTSTVTANITSLSVTPGDWDVRGTGLIVPVGVFTFLGVGISLVSASLPAYGVEGYQFAPGSTVSGINYSWPTGPIRMSFAVTTTVYLVTQGSFTSTATAFGTISARRMR